MVNIDTILSKCDTNQIHDLSNYAMYYHGKDWVAAGATLETYLKSLDETEFRKVFIRNSLKYESYYEKDWDKYYSKIPMWIWLVSLFILTILAFFYNLSLIPLLGVICCLYMMAQIPLQNWIGFGIWLIVGLILYFCYGYKHSKLNLYRG